MIVSRKRPSEGNYEKEKDLCIKYFDQWSESDQVEFVEHLISRMCHYQHGHINSYLKPMLQRDFITALPGKLMFILQEVHLQILFLFSTLSVCKVFGTSSRFRLSCIDEVMFPSQKPCRRVAGHSLL